MTRSTLRPVVLALLSLGLASCRQESTSTPPPTPGELAAASQLNRGELSDGVAVPYFDEDGYYEMVEVIFVPAQGEAPARTAEVQISLDPKLVKACGLPRADVSFATDSARIPRSKTGMLEHLADCLNKSPLDDDYLQIVGYTDPRGAAEYNRELGLVRADAVASVLIEHGVTKARIDTYSLGEAVATNDPQHWPSERKVTIRLDR